MAGLGCVAACVDVGVAAGRSGARTNGSARRAVRELVVSYGHTNEAVELPRILIQEKQTLDQQRETIRIETEVENLVEILQVNIKTWREALIVQEGDSMDKNKSHVLSPESLAQEVTNFQTQELCLTRAAAVKRMAGASKRRDARSDSWLEFGDGPNRSGDMLKTTARCQTMAWTVASSIRTCQCSAGTLRGV